MTEQELINSIECMKIMRVETERKPFRYVAMNENTKFKLHVTTILNMEILIDDKLADDEFRLLRK